jgi:hypothetical protein
MQLEDWGNIYYEIHRAYTPGDISFVCDLSVYNLKFMTTAINC